jgi:hypothetical protein
MFSTKQGILSQEQGIPVAQMRKSDWGDRRNNRASRSVHQLRVVGVEFDIEIGGSIRAGDNALCNAVHQVERSLLSGT